MKCDKCKTNEASFHKVSNINGKVSELHLCSECAKSSKEFNVEKEFEMFNSRSKSFLNDFISDFNSSFSYFASPMLENFLDFDSFIDDEIFAPKKLLQNNKEEKVKEHINNLTEEEKNKLEIQKLDLQLKKAVVEERYEDAVVLRDKIKKLKEKIN